MNGASQNFKIQKNIAIISVVLLLVKLFAWYITHSVAVLTDALESIVNVISGFVGLYSLYLSGKPRDMDHPYGHGKVEFLSAATEGILIGIAGILIIKEAVINLYHPHEIHRIDLGLLLVALTAIVNLMAGMICVKTGKKNNSLALIASGKHLMADTYTTAGIIAGLLLLFVTGIVWIDSVVAIVFAFVIMYTGYKIVRSSVAGIMDEADTELLEKMIGLLNRHRKVNWIDLHNLRIIKYGSTIHVDCHLTVPWYFNVHEAHREIDGLSEMVKNQFGESVELFVHSDGCLDFSCAICEKPDCRERQHDFIRKIEWDLENVSANQKHQIAD